MNRRNVTCWASVMHTQTQSVHPVPDNGQWPALDTRALDEHTHTHTMASLTGRMANVHFLFDRGEVSRLKGHWCHLARNPTHTHVYVYVCAVCIGPRDRIVGCKSHPLFVQPLTHTRAHQHKLAPDGNKSTTFFHSLCLSLPLISVMLDGNRSMADYARHEIREQLNRYTYMSTECTHLRIIRPYCCNIWWKILLRNFDCFAADTGD